jgi:homoserine kinase
MTNLAVRVPATSANLGPGFDVLGMALSLYATVAMSPIAETEAISDGHPAMQAFVRAGGEGSLWVDSPIPSGRGLGFSGAVRVGGACLGLAQKAGATAPDLPIFISQHQSEIINIAAELEGHFDNVAASVMGGIVAASPLSTVAVPVASEVLDHLQVVAWVPFFQTSTATSRATLSTKIDREVAVFNIARSTQLVIALTTGNRDLLRNSMSDRLHQDQRLAETPQCHAVFNRMLEMGAISSWLSGSGPTVAAFVERNDAAKIAELLSQDFPDGHAKVLSIDRLGLRGITV